MQLIAVAATTGRKLMSSIDVVVPNYQYGRYLGTCVRSVLSQPVSDLRVLIIDNASTDQSLDVARRLAAEDRRVSLVAHPHNLGQHASFNEGVDWAEARYFLILCSDDALTPGSLARALAVLESDAGICLAFGRVETLGADETPRIEAAGDPSATWLVESGSELLERLCRTGRNLVPGPTAVVRTSAQKVAGHYRASLPHTDDLEMWMRIARLGRVAETTATQGFLRIHPENRCSTVPDVLEWDLAVEAAFDSFFRFEMMPHGERVRLRRLAMRGLCDRAYWGALANLLRGQHKLAAKQLQFCLARRPSSLFLPPLGHLLSRTDLRDKLGEVLAGLARRAA